MVRDPVRVLNPNPSPYLPDYAVLALNPNNDLIASLIDSGGNLKQSSVCAADRTSLGRAF